MGIIYRDIKLENILLDSNGHIVITDFGLSKELSEEESGRAYSFCGTIEYMAPEVVRGGETGHDIAVDWWSVGVLTYELLTGASPFTKDGENNHQQDISKRILKDPPPFPTRLGHVVKDLISKLLIKDPRKRLGGGGQKDAREIKRHPFFKNIDWDQLSKKQMPAPFKPLIRDELDTSNFSDDFTKLPIADSPTAVPHNSDRLFRGYSFVSPSILREKQRTLAEQLVQPAENLRPNPLEVFYNKDPVSQESTYSLWTATSFVLFPSLPELSLLPQVRTGVGDPTRRWHLLRVHALHG